MLGLFSKMMALVRHARVYDFSTPQKNVIQMFVAFIAFAS